MTDRHDAPETNQSEPIAEKRNRRRFLGAGVASTPFLLTLVSQPALGVQCFTPSRALSRNTSLSQTGKIGECTGAQSPGNYKTQQSNGGRAYNWPASVPSTTLMHPLFYMGSQQGVTKFTKPNPNGTGSVSKTLGEALNVNAAGQVHFHLIGAYLNKMGGNGAIIPDTVLTAQNILNMWQEYVTKGYFEPMAGIKWYATEIVYYLKSNGIVA